MCVCQGGYCHTINSGAFGLHRVRNVIFVICVTRRQRGSIAGSDVNNEDGNGKHDGRLAALQRIRNDGNVFRDRIAIHVGYRVERTRVFLGFYLRLLVLCTRVNRPITFPGEAGFFSMFVRAQREQTDGWGFIVRRCSPFAATLFVGP